MAHHYCHPLSDAKDAAEFGGKAGHLARVQQLGHRVPETIVVDRDALRLFLSANELQPSI